LFGVGLLTGLKVLYVVIFISAQMSGYLLARSFLSRSQSLISSMIYVLLPAYPLIALHRNFLANAFALSLAPLVLLGAKLILERADAGRGRIIFLLSFSAVILSHAITSYLCLLAIGLLIICRLIGRDRQGIAQLFIAGLITISLTAFFIVPQLLELSWTQVGLQTDFQNYRNYFLFAPAADGSDYREGWAKFNTFFSLVTILPTLFGVLAAVIIRLTYKSDNGHQVDRLAYRFGLALVIFGLAISLPVSEPLWKVLPGLKFIQFPWRFQPLVALGCGLLMASISHGWSMISKTLRLILIGILTAMSLTGLFFTWVTMSLDDSGESRINVAEYLNPTTARPLKFEEWQALLSEDNEKYAWYAANQIYFRPKQSDLTLYPPVSEVGRLKIIKGSGRVLSQELEVSHREFYLDNAERTQIRVETYRYPHWVARLDGREIKVDREEGTGLMLLEVPAGRHRLTLDFEVRSISEIVARYVSAAAWAIFAIWLVVRRWRRV